MPSVALALVRLAEAQQETSGNLERIADELKLLNSWMPKAAARIVQALERPKVRRND